MRKFKKKVIVAMSGGVDSSVTAALLKRAGFNVIGVFLKFTDLPSLKAGEKKARKVAKILKIPFLVLDLRREFNKRIINYFLEGYKKGITPNPCVVCNKEIKFGLLLEEALKLDASYLATGHYACLCQGKLLRARDRKKDQSYFLWMLSQKQLKRILFPIGDYIRTEVEKLAKKFKLTPVLKAKKSVETCFIQKTIHPVKSREAGAADPQFNGVNDFLKKYLKQKPGNIVNIEGKIIGKHEGLWFYTVGQRKGIGLASGPYWVLDKDLKKNILVITKNEKDLYKKELVAKNINWISGRNPKLPLKVRAKIRYRQKAVPATITKILNSKIYIMKFDKPQRAVTPGQSVVFYRGQELLGGGIIC